MEISVIIPTLNEADNISRCIESVKRLNPLEIIVVDGGSTDRTKQIAQRYEAKVIESQKGRGIQMNLGASISKGDVLLFLHADSVFEEDISQDLLNLKDCVAGFFKLRFNDNSISLRLVEIFANLRARWFSLPYGDQALFLRREVFNSIGGFKNYPFLEDLDLVLRLRMAGRLKGLYQKVIVSSRRLKRGYPLSPIVISVRNVLIALLFILGISPYNLLSIYR